MNQDPYHPGMNHSSLGRLDQNGFVVAPAVMGLLRLKDHATLTGLYYPKPAHPVEEYGPAPGEIDFMFTAVPYRLWPVAARMKFRVRHRVGTVAAVTALLARHGVNILQADCGRSGHRFATLTLTVAFEDLLAELGPLPSTEKILALRISVETRIKAIHEEILQCSADYSEILFGAIEGTEPDPPVMGQPITALNYFFRVNESRRTKRPLLRPFAATYVNGLIRPEPGFWTHFLKKYAGELPTRTLYDVNTKYANLRIAVFEKGAAQLRRRSCRPLPEPSLLGICVA